MRETSPRLPSPMDRRHVFRLKREGAAPEGAQVPDLDTLYRAHAQRVARWASRLAGPSLDAEDLVQEVFLTAQRLLPGFRGEAEVTTWLYRITANVVRHRRRKDRVRRWLGGSAEDVAGRIASLRPTPVEDLEQRQAAELLYRALAGMAEKYRSVLILFELEGLSGEEIARLTGTRPATLRVWLHRARGQLVERITRIERRRHRERPAAARAIGDEEGSSR